MSPILVAIGGGALLLMGLALYTNAGASYDPCATLESIQAKKCRVEKLTAEFEQGGIFAAVAYAQSTIGEHQTSGECHLLMHTLGQLAYEADADIKRQLAVNLGFCTGGFLHGTLEAYFTDKGFVADFDRSLLSVCNADLDMTARGWECTHGVGHALMYVYENDIFRSVEQCDELSVPWQRKACYFGAFMENSYQRAGDRYVGPEIRFVDWDDPRYPCTDVDTDYKQMCYFFPGNNALWDIMRVREITFDQLTTEDFKRAFDVCKSAGPGTLYRNNCIRGTAIYIYIAYPDDLKRMHSICSLPTSPDEQYICHMHLAKTIARYDIENEGGGKTYCDLLAEEIKHVCALTLQEWWYSSIDMQGPRRD